MIFQAILWITELCEVLTKTQMEAVQPNADIDALNAEQQKFEKTAQVRHIKGVPYDSLKIVRQKCEKHLA